MKGMLVADTIVVVILIIVVSPPPCKRELSRVFQICVLLQGGSTRPGWGSVQGMLSNP